ncbi:MAG: hypothetical protein H6607_10735 [Flavobacteriales bacterium]|nr:hypothetical protein [Flavobacteriales bacterium]
MQTITEILTDGFKIITGIGWVLIILFMFSLPALTVYSILRAWFSNIRFSKQASLSIAKYNLTIVPIAIHLIFLVGIFYFDINHSIEIPTFKLLVSISFFGLLIESFIQTPFKEKTVLQKCLQILILMLPTVDFICFLTQITWYFGMNF